MSPLKWMEIMCLFDGMISGNWGHFLLTILVWEYQEAI